MDRETRKANLKKLQLPRNQNLGACGSSLRETRPVITSISKYFNTSNEKTKKSCIQKSKCGGISALNSLTTKMQQQDNIAQEIEMNDCTRNSVKAESSNTKTVDPILRKRTKLTDFVFQDTNLKRYKQSGQGKGILLDDFETPHKQIMKVPKLSIPNNNKKSMKASAKTCQPNIKSAFLRNEQIFSEITAQHCRVEHFNPDEIQLALAISRSEAETSSAFCSDSQEDIVVELVENKADRYENKKSGSIRSMLQKYGFHTATQEDYNSLAAAFLPGANRRIKSKCSNKISALTLRNPTDQEKKVNTKIRSFMGQQLISRTSNGPEKRRETYSLLSVPLQKLEAVKTFPNSIMKKCGIEMEIDLDVYYVHGLFECSRIYSGYLLKDWYAIQGRDMSPPGNKCNENKKHAHLNRMNSAYKKLEKHFGMHKNESQKERMQDNERGAKITKNEIQDINPNVCRNNITNTSGFLCSTTNNNDVKKLMDATEDGKVLEISAIDNGINERSASNKYCSLPQICTAKCITPRTHSPDIFGSSEEDLEEEQIQVSRTIAGAIDLTQDDESNTEHPEGQLSNLQHIELLCNGITHGPMKAVEDGKMDRSMKAVEEGGRSYINKQVNDDEYLRFDEEPDIASTQNEGSGDEDYIMLSDDEINYSILKADKSLRFKDIDVSHHTENSHEFSILEMIDEHIKVPEIQEEERTAYDMSAFMSNDPELINTNISSVQSNMPYTCDRSHERLEFGVLSNISEPLAQAPPRCHEDGTKRASALNNFELVDSSCENYTFMKRCSVAPESTRKFNSFLKTIPKVVINGDFNLKKIRDFDEFDKLIYDYEIPTKKRNKQVNSEISCNLAEDEVFRMKVSPQEPYMQLRDYLPDEYEISGRKYTATIVTDPKPDFIHQTEAEILKQLYRFGIKPLRRKYAVKMIEYIYNQTHPLILEKKPILIAEGKFDDIAEELNSAPYMENTEAEISQKHFNMDICSTSTKNVLAPISNHSVSRPNKLQFEDCEGFKILRFRQKLPVEFENEDYIFQTNITKKTIQPLLPLHIAWYNLVCSSIKLYEAILLYDPIDLQELHLFFKQLGYRFEPKDMKKFFDRRCIFFRYDISPSDRQSKRKICSSRRKYKK